MNEITINQDDARLARQLIHESQAATEAYQSTRTRNVCIGAGAVVLASGIGLAALVWAWGQGVDPEALKAALANMPPLKVETTVKDGEVTLRDGAKVELAPGSMVEVTGNVGQPAPVKLPDLPTPEGDKIKREVVVYTQAHYANGEVHTGWRFPNGSAKTPISEFCYFAVDHNDGSSERIDLGENGKFDSRSTKLLPSARDAFNKCSWFRGVI